VGPSAADAGAHRKVELSRSHFKRKTLGCARGLASRRRLGLAALLGRLGHRHRLAALLAEPALFRGRKVVLVLCGGNIDTRLLASVLTRSLVREKRITSVRIIGNDQPGLLARVSTVIGESGGNIIEVFHNRMALDVPAKGAEFDITIETRDALHTQDIIDALTEAGFPPRTA
jgi:UTP:GlnB (protein PII) uridylyltransferase